MHTLTLEIEHTTKMKRSFISPLDKKMIQSTPDSFYAIRFTNYKTDKSYLSNLYYQSNLYLRIIARITTFDPRCICVIAEHSIAKRNDQLIAGEITWLEAFQGLFDEGTNIHNRLKRYVRMMSKCYRFCMDTNLLFGTHPLLRSFSLEVLEDQQTYAYYRCVPHIPKTAAVLGLGMLKRAPTFLELDQVAQKNWLEFLAYEVNGVRHDEQLILVKSIATELGEDYNFLLESCNELLI